jgi:hypothetical protein
MKLLSILVIASTVVLMASTSADAYWRHRRFYDAAYIGSHQRLGYRGPLYGLAGPAYAFGDPAYGGCRLGHELIGTAWGPRVVRVRACPAGSGRYRSRYYGY